MEFLKKQKIGFMVNVLVAIMTIISLAVYIANVSAPYYRDMNTGVVIMMTCAIALIVAAVIIPQIAKGKYMNFVSDACRIAAAVLIILSGTMFISMRVESFGYIFNSNLELGNEAAFSAGSQAVIAIVLFIATWVLSVIASFFEIGEKHKAVKE